MKSLEERLLTGYFKKKYCPICLKPIRFFRKKIGDNFYHKKCLKRAKREREAR